MEYSLSTAIWDHITSFYVFLEIILAFLVIWLCFKKSPKDRLKLTKEEEDNLVANFQPEPLVDESRSQIVLEKRVLSGKIGKQVVVNGVPCLNLSTHDYLGFSESGKIEEDALQCIKKYGVGSCGPRGFYGTMDEHLKLEDLIAKFMGLEEAIVYSYGFSTVASAIPAYSKRGDIIFADEAINFSVQQGLTASRSTVKYFRHNDIEDLEKLLAEQEDLDRKNPRRAAKTRKFLVVEGIYLNTGEICPLPELVSLKNKYKLRLFIDEGVSIGTLGPTGRGVTEYFGISVREVDLIMGSLERSVSSIGGFCVGTSYIVDHQRLSGLGYCFSASQPPLLTTAAITAINTINSQPELVTSLQHKAEYFYNTMKSSLLMNWFELTGHVYSPVKHFQFQSNSKFDLLQQKEILGDVVVHCLKNGIAITTPSYLDMDKTPKKVTIRFCITNLLSNSDMDQVVSLLEGQLIPLVK